MTLKFAIRNISKRPFLNLIKVTGLGLALSGILLIILFLTNELTFDRFHKKSDRIYRLTTTDQTFITGRHFARVYNTDYIPGMAEYFPEIENYVRLAPIRGGVVKHYEEFILVNEAFECDSTFFDVFDSELLAGNTKNILDGPGSMVLSESFAEKVFGTANPVGQILTLHLRRNYNCHSLCRGARGGLLKTEDRRLKSEARRFWISSWEGWGWIFREVLPSLSVLMVYFRFVPQ